MRILADENIPLLTDYFSRFGQVFAVNGRNLQRDQVDGADVLLVRSVTGVNAALLEGTPVRFVGTCTIGTDHLDKDYLHRAGIAYASAPGCNAGGVVQYVLTALTQLRPDWRQLTVGVVGCGNVGGRLHRTLQRLGVASVGYDPFLAPGADLNLVNFDTLLQSDVICVHTPLTRTGAHPTRHMIDRGVLERLRPGTLLLNAGRGGAVDNTALLAHVQQGADLQVVLDVWEQEPDINRELARLVDRGTPHIAGYSREGRVNGSIMICRALAEFMGWSNTETETHLQAVRERTEGGEHNLPADTVEEALAASYDLWGDHQRLLAAVNGDAPLGPAFDALRKHYPERHEPPHYRVTPAGTGGASAELAAVGFQVAATGAS